MSQISVQLARPGLTYHRTLYQQGRQYRLELLDARRLRPDYQDPRTFFRLQVASPPLSQIDEKWRIADSLAAEGGTNRGTMREAYWVAIAVDNIVAACDQEGPVSAVKARRLLLGDHLRLSVPTIMTISKMAPPRQRYALHQAAQGRSPLKPAKDIHVFDTAGFGEVLSRLWRTEGSLSKGLRFLTGLHAIRRSELHGYGVKLHPIVNQLRVSAPELSRLVLRMSVRESDAQEQTPQDNLALPCTGPRPFASQAAVWSEVFAGVASASAFLVKTVRDLSNPPRHEMVHMAATSREKEVSLAWLDHIAPVIRELDRVLVASRKFSRS